MDSIRFFRRKGVLFAAAGLILAVLLFGAGQSPAASASFSKGRVVAQQPVTVQPLLIVSPREINFGPIGSGSVETGSCVLRNLGGGSLQWTLSPPEGWACGEIGGLGGPLDVRAAEIQVRLKYARKAPEQGAPLRKTGVNPLVLTLEYGGQTLTCRREATTGVHREVIRINSTGGSRSLFLRYQVVSPESEPLIHLTPLRVDFGSVTAGERVARRVELTNRGRDTLVWSVGLPESPSTEGGLWPPPGRYISFYSELAKGKGTYASPGTLKPGLDLSGAVWSEEDGYPVGTGQANSLRLRFSGTGITLYYWKGPEGGEVSAFLADRFLQAIQCRAEQRESAETLLAEDLPDGNHVLTLVSVSGRAVLQGVRIAGKPVQKGSAGWITVFPKSGTTLRETDYVNVVANTQHLAPGWYADQIHFSSNGGEKTMEVSLEVTAENPSRLLDVYRYSRGADYFFTTNPRAELPHLQAGGYVKEGIAFRLFSPGTPGTTSFYRWYNQKRGDRYYGYDLQGGGMNLQGYVLEGVIGNIATSRLAQTRELYRWSNPSRGVHFFTTDPKGEGIEKKGYRFDGIAGYVR
jgi:hypothetical protein